LPQDAGGKGRGALGNRGSSWGYLSGLLQKLKRELAAPFESDHVALLRAVECFEEAEGEAAVRCVCERYSLNRNAVQSIVDVRDKLKRELMHQRLLTDDMAEFANRNSGDYSVLLAVVAAGVFPNLAVKRTRKKKIEANGGRVDAITHPSSIAVGKAQGKSHGKGSFAASEWLCYTEMTQVEQRYSITGVSWASPVALLLLCGDDPIEVQGYGADVSASLLDGWAEFVMPKQQVMLLQNLRYSLRQGFAAYCSSPERGLYEFSETLDSTVALLQASMDETGRPLAGEVGYKPRVAAYSSNATTLSSAADYKVLADAVVKTASIASTKAEASKTPVSTTPHKLESTLQEGLEIAGLTDLIRELYGPPLHGQRLIEWQFSPARNGNMEATLTIPHDGSTYAGPSAHGRKLAQRLAAKVAWEALKAMQTEYSIAEMSEEVADEEDVQEVLADDDVDEEADQADEDLEGMDCPGDAEEVEEPNADEEGDQTEESLDCVLDGEEEVEEVEDAVDGTELNGAALDMGLEVETGDGDGDLLDDIDPSMEAALRFMQGDSAYKDSAQSEEAADSPLAWKRRRLT